MEKNTIVYTSDNIDELYKLTDSNGKIDTDKICDWLLNSNDLEYDSEVRANIIKTVRERKLKKINKKL